jgi:hypothetical protein
MESELASIDLITGLPEFFNLTQGLRQTPAPLQAAVPNFRCWESIAQRAVRHWLPVPHSRC